MGVGLDPLPNARTIMTELVRIDEVDGVATGMGAFSKLDVKAVRRFDRNANRQVQAQSVNATTR